MLDGTEVDVFAPGHEVGEVKFLWSQDCPPSNPIAWPLVLQRQHDGFQLKSHQGGKLVEVLIDEPMVLDSRDALQDHRRGLHQPGCLECGQKDLRSGVVLAAVVTLRAVWLAGEPCSKYSSSVITGSM